MKEAKGLFEARRKRLGTCNGEANANAAARICLTHPRKEVMSWPTPMFDPDVLSSSVAWSPVTTSEYTHLWPM